MPMLEKLHYCNVYYINDWKTTLINNTLASWNFGASEGTVIYEYFLKIHTHTVLFLLLASFYRLLCLVKCFK